MSCKFCNFDLVEGDAYDIGLYEVSSLEYKGTKYFLDLTYPFDGEEHSDLFKVKACEVFFCPICGRDLYKKEGDTE